MDFTSDQIQQDTDAEEPVTPNGSNPNQCSPPVDPPSDQVLVDDHARADQYLANWQRAQADLSNFRKRVEQEREDLIRQANAGVISSILPVLDDLERALANVEPRLVGLTWIDGVRLVYHRLRSVLESHGVVTIDAIGKEFDPREHEAMLYGEGDEGIVVGELQKGYKLHERLLRPALVRVGQGQGSQPEPISPGNKPPDSQPHAETTENPSAS